MPGSIEVVLPGLFDIPPGELDPDGVGGRLENLDRFLTLATPRASISFSIDGILQAVLQPDVGPAAVTGLPLAQAFVDSDHAEAVRLLLFQAIHLRADMQNAVVVPIETNQENLKDIYNIINDLKDLFNPDCHITAVADGLYLMQLEHFDAPDFYPQLLSVLGKTANPYLEHTRRLLPWYKLLNEMQMFLHQHPVNQARQQRGLLPINSLWFWGGGARPEKPKSDPIWCCDDPILNRFAGSIGLTVMPLQALDKIGGTDNAVIIELDLLAKLKSGGDQALDQNLLNIDRLMGSLLRIARQENRSLTLRAGFDYDFECSPLARFKWWRRERNLLDWVG